MPAEFVDSGKPALLLAWCALGCCFDASRKGEVEVVFLVEFEVEGGFFENDVAFVQQVVLYLRDRIQKLLVYYFRDLRIKRATLHFRLTLPSGPSLLRQGLKRVNPVAQRKFAVIHAVYVECSLHRQSLRRCALAGPLAFQNLVLATL